VGLSPPSITSDHSLKGIPCLVFIVRPLRICVQSSIGIRHDLCPHLDQDALCGCGGNNQNRAANLYMYVGGHTSMSLDGDQPDLVNICIQILPPMVT